MNTFDFDKFVASIPPPRFIDSSRVVTPLLVYQNLLSLRGTVDVRNQTRYDQLVWELKEMLK